MFLYFKRREKRGKREAPRQRFLVLRRKTLTVGAALLAAAANTDALGISVAQLKDAVQQLVPEKFHALNLGAIDYVCSR